MLRTRIYLAAAVIVGSVALYSLHTLLAQQELAAITHEILDKRIVKIQAADKVKHMLLRDEIALFHYVATGNENELDKGEQFGQKALDEIQILQRLSQSTEAQALLIQLESETRRYFADARRTVAWTHQRPGGRPLDILSAESENRRTRINAFCDRIIAMNQEEIESSRVQMRQTLRQGHRNALLAVFLVGLVVLLVSVGHSRSLLQPLNVLMQGVRRVEQGDMDFQIPVHSADELGRLTSSFNKMTRTVARQRQELRRDSITDGLTGLYNQRHFRSLLKQETERAQRTQASFSLLMIDIDHFKQYNDAMGHEAGNEVIMSVAEALRGTLRDIDTLARYGGDEMSVILPDTTASEAKILAQRMASAIRNAPFPGEKALPTSCVTLSIGGASYPEDAQSAPEMILKADKALYIAKRAGRSCFRWASDIEYVQKTV